MSQKDKILSLIGELENEVGELLLERRRGVEPIQDLGQRVRQQRKEQKLTLLDLADLAGVSTGTLKRIESGNSDVALSNIQKVLDSLGIGLWIG